MRQMLWAIGLSILATSASAQPAEIAKDDAGKTYLKTPAGMTLYVFDDDGMKGNGSKCTDQCSEMWPPFTSDNASAAANDWAVISRADGSKQWTYKGRPLYTFTKDHKPGERNGNSYNGNRWHVAQP